MKFYRCKKSSLHWKEMDQITKKWNLPILIDTDMNVIIGNSLKDCLPEDVIVITADPTDREILFNALYEIEKSVVAENDPIRLDSIQNRFREFFIEVRRKKNTFTPLFEFKERGLITEENYIEPPPYNFNKHGNSQLEMLYNGGNYLSDELAEILEIIEENQDEDEPIEIDLEIMKELL